MRGHAVDLAAVRASRERLRALAAAHPELCGERGADNVDGWEQTLTEDEENMANTTQFGFRLPDELVERLDSYVERMKEGTPGLGFTRADAVRVLLTAGLDAADVKAKPKGGKKGGR
jgi:two-component sensor histidine kinase